MVPRSAVFMGLAAGEESCKRKLNLRSYLLPIQKNYDYPVSGNRWNMWVNWRGWQGLCWKIPLIKRFYNFYIQPQVLASTQMTRTSLNSQPSAFGQILSAAPGRPMSSQRVDQGQPLHNSRTWLNPSTTASLCQGRHQTPAPTQPPSPPRRKQGSKWKKELCPIEQKNSREGKCYLSGSFPGKAVSGRPGHRARRHWT